MSKRKEVPDTDEAEEEPRRCETSPERFVDGSKAVFVRFIATPLEAEAIQSEGSPAFPAEYVHQIFEPDGAIECPPEERPMRIEVAYSAASLDYVVLPSGSGKAVTQAAQTLAATLPSPPAAAIGGLVEATTSFAPAGAVAGERITEYARDGRSYEVYSAALGAEAPPERLRFAERLQSIFRFCIETSSAIDHGDERWRVVTIFEAPAGGEPYRLVAASTLFSFKRWLPRRGPVLLLRVCQVVTLPAFRSHGHGARLLQAIYELAGSLDAAEVTVEDPNDSFRLLRDRVDYRNACERGLLAPESTDGPPSSEAVDDARSALRLTEEQCVRVHEMRQLAKLREAGGSVLAEEVIKPFRLLVKKRLAKKHKEELDAMLSLHAREENEPAAGASSEGDAPPSREALVALRKERLQAMWAELLAEYDSALSVARAPAATAVQ